ncbi:MAG: hypothetical protein QOK33_1149 [Mycobacterium sp.]|jgi:hypothetical protein|nr:hypothetical protein [Mycobacterium sp.]MDT5397918.1 hypothetical protein [Mycobacterium sp.]
MFRRSLAASTIFEEPGERDNTIEPAGSECPTVGLRSSRNSTPLVAINTIEPAGYYGIQRNQTTIAKQVTTVAPCARGRVTELSA